MNKMRYVLLVVLLGKMLFASSQVYLTEGFETGAKPDGWTEQYISGTEPWRYRNGGHSPNDNNWLVPAYEEDITRNPASAYDGTYNAIFFKQSDNNERTMLITPEMDLLGGTSIELSFYLCQMPWTFEGSTGWDILRVYYKTSAEGSWILLHEYLDPVYEWELQSLVLPNPTETYYVAFEGQTRWGYGTCIDNVVVEEKGSQDLWIKEIDFEQPFSEYVPSGSPDVPLMRIGFKVFGNTGEALLEEMAFRSLGSDDSDFETGSIKLYSTLSQVFSKDNQIGSASSFSEDVVSFTGLNHSLPPGQSYVWLVGDIKMDVDYGNTLDIMVEPESILANDTLYPATAESPNGQLTVYHTQYFEDFEGIHNWEVSGEFEVAAPAGLGGIPGNPDPDAAFSGSLALGTDLTGTGANPYNYEPGVSEAASYKATSPVVDLFYYKNLNLFFERYLNIEVWDEASIQVSSDSGVSWNTVWASESFLNDFQWSQIKLAIPDSYSRTEKFRIRYVLGPTDGQNNYSGWNVDDIYITGEFISRDVGVSEWIYPQSGSGHSATDSVMVRIRNYGGALVTDPVPVSYSFDGGMSWTTDIMNTDIPVGSSVVFTFPTKVDLSTPGLYPNILAKTVLADDQYTGNDQITTSIYVVPTFFTPYSEDLEGGDDYWQSLGSGIWEYGTPAGTVISSAASGISSYATGLVTKYGDLVADKNRIILEDEFEEDNGWTFTGEFEREVPDNMYLPYFAYSGYYCIGTDLSGTGINSHMYENNITPATAFTALSPKLNISNYSDVKLSFADWLVIQAGDSVRLEISPDDGNAWYTLWSNSGAAVSNEDFYFRQFDIPDSLSYSTEFRIRFSLYYTSAAGAVAEGWFIDDVVLAGDLIDGTPGYLTSPRFNLSAATEPVLSFKLWTDTEQDVDGLTLMSSTDEGESWDQVANITAYDDYWNWYNGDYVEALGTDGWSGHSGEWIQVRHLLPAELKGNDNVMFRLVFAADKFNNDFDGAAVDDFMISEAPHDIGILSVISPVSACELSTEEQFTMRLKNFGVRNINAGEEVSVGYHIDKDGTVNDLQENYTLTQGIPAGGTLDVTFDSEFDFSESGTYNIMVYTIDEQPYYYSAVANDTVWTMVDMNKPLLDLGPDISTVRPDTVILTAYSGIPDYTYKWQDNSADSVFNVSVEGTYSVQVTNSLLCSAFDTVEVLRLMADVGFSSVVSPVSDCELGSAENVVAMMENFGTDTLETGDTIFISGYLNGLPSFTDTLVLAARFQPGESLEYTCPETFDFSLQGSYAVKLYTILTDDITNTNDTINQLIETYGYPPVDLGEDRIIEAADYVLNAPAGYNDYLWQDGSSLDNFTVQEPGTGHYYVAVSDIHGCMASDSVYITLNVNDIGIARVLSPETSCGLSEQIEVSVRIRNVGNQVIAAGETLLMGYVVDSNPANEENLELTGDLAPGDSLDFVFTVQTGVVAGQWYDFTVYTSMTGDMVSSNDTMLVPVGVFASPEVDLGEDFQVVAGLSYVLDAGEGFASYLWQDGSTGQTFTVTEPGIRTYSVTVTDANGCIASDAIQLMLAVPDVGISSLIQPLDECSTEVPGNVGVMVKNFGNQSITASTTIGMVYSVNGGVDVSESLVLSEDLPEGGEVPFIFSAQEDLSLPGVYTLRVNTVYGEDLVTGNDTLISGFELYAHPAIMILPDQDSISVTDTLQLSVTPGFESYLWQDGSVNDSLEVNQMGKMFYTVYVTNEYGCTSGDSIYVHYIGPDLELSAIKSPTANCAYTGDNIVEVEVRNNGLLDLAAGESVSLSYRFNNGATVKEVLILQADLASGQTVDYSFYTPVKFGPDGNFDLLAAINNAYDEEPADNQLTATVEVWPLPEVIIGSGADTLYVAVPYILDAGQGYTSYLWQNGLKNRTISANSYGLYWVEVSNAQGCTDRDSVYVLKSTGIGDMDLIGDRIKIYPNPASSEVFIETRGLVADKLVLELYSSADVLLRKMPYEGIKYDNTLRMSVDDLVPGVYFIRMMAGEESWVVKLVIQ